MRAAKYSLAVRILFLSAGYALDGGPGGIESAIASIAPALVARGHDVHVLACAEDCRSGDDTDAGLHLHRRRATRIHGLRRAVGWPAAWRIETALSNYRESRRLGVTFDVVEGPDWGAEGLLFALRRRTPLVTHLHTPLPVVRRFNGLVDDRAARWAAALERFTVRRSDVLTAPAPILVEELSRLGWVAKRWVEIIPYALDWWRWRDAASVSDTRPSVLFAGRLEARKAPEDLLEAVRLLGEEISDVGAVFVGKSSGERNGAAYRASLEGEAGAARCVFVDHVPRHRLVDYLGAARVVAVPSRFESFSLVAAEAMAAGRPVVVTSTTGIADLVRKADAGEVVPPGDHRALADALRRFLISPACARETGERGRRAVMELLDPPRVAALREAAYRRAMGKETA